MAGVGYSSMRRTGTVQMDSETPNRRGDGGRKKTCLSFLSKSIAYVFIVAGLLVLSTSLSKFNGTTQVHSNSSPVYNMPHIAIIYDRFPGVYEGTDEYVLQMMQVLRSWRWSVTLVTLLQGQGVQMENFPFVQDMGVRVVMMSGATVITSRGEISAALETLPKVDMFFVFQTFRSNHIVAPIAILRPFQVHARIIVFNTDMHSLRLHMYKENEKALEDGTVMPDPQDRFTAKWIPATENSQRSVLNEDLEQFVIERRSLHMADRVYFSSEEDRQRGIDLVCDVVGDECDKKHLETRTRIFTLGNPRNVAEVVAPWKSRKKIVFVGGESNVNNINLRYFTDRILPKIREEMEDVEVEVFTKDCQDQPGMNCRFWQDSLEETAVLVAYPALAGTGIHLKNWMPLSMGVPVITTPLGGIQFNGEDSGIVVASNAVLFALACLDLMRNENRWNKLSANALKYARSKQGNYAEESLHDIAELLVSKRPEAQQSSIEESDIISLEGWRLAIKTGPLKYRSTADMASLGERPTNLAEDEIQSTMCDTAPRWQAPSGSLRFLLVYWRNPSQFYHFDRDVVQLIKTLTSLRHPVTVLTLMPIAQAIITNEQALRDLGVHFVHLKDVMNEDSTKAELRVIKECLKFDVVILTLDSMDEYAKTPRVLMTPSVYTIYLPYLADKTLELDGMKRKGFNPIVKTGVDENEILKSMDERFKRLFWYERNDAQKADYVLFSSNIYQEKAKSVFCGSWYQQEARAPEAECFLDSKSDAVLDCVRVDDVGNRTLVFPSPESRNRILFVGSDTAMNLEGVGWFIIRVLPKVLTKAPALQMTLFGPICNLLKNYSSMYEIMSKVECISDGLEIDLQRLLAKTRVFINPMVSGIDSNARNMMPLKNGIPLVVTPVAAQGFGEGPHLSIGRSEEEFAESVSTLALDQNAWIKQSESGEEWLLSNRVCANTVAWAKKLTSQLKHRIEKQEAGKGSRTGH